MTLEDNVLLMEKVSRNKQQAKAFFEEKSSNKLFLVDVNTLIIKLDDSYYVSYKQLGSGAQGEVYVGRELEFNRTPVALSDGDVAIKLGDVSEQGFAGKDDITRNIERGEAQNTLLKELEISKGFGISKRTKNTYVEAYKEKRDCNVTETISIIPFHSGKDVKAHKDAFSYGSFSIASMAFQACEGLSRLHNQNVLHNDIKPANILWDTENSEVHIVDYDSAARLPDTKDYIETIYSSDKAYMAPETIQEDKGYQFTKASDVYSMGKTLQEKFPLNKPYLSYPELIMKKQINKMISESPDQRPSIEACSQVFSEIAKLGAKFTSDNSSYFVHDLGKLLVLLERYINKYNVQQKMAKTLGQKLGLTANQQQKYENATELLETIIKYASQEPVNLEQFKDKIESIIKKEEASQGVLSSKGELRAILDNASDRIKAEQIGLNTMRH